jgi:hypothetical protein
VRYGGALTERVVGGVNTWVDKQRTSARWGRLVSRHITVVTYTGRRSGRTFSTPVGYRRKGDDTVLIGVRLPNAKTWWRNFTGTGGPLSLVLDGADRTGHAIAHRDDKGRVVINVRLDG